MAGTLVIGCGTLGCSVVSRLSDKDIRSVTVNWTNADLALLPSGGPQPRTPEEADAVLRPRANEIMLPMTGVTEAIIVSSSGSLIGDAFVRLLSETAGNRFPIILVTTVPFRFEEGLRSAGIARIASYPELVDRVFVMDLQYSGHGEKVIGEAMQAVSAYIASVAEIIADLVGTIPFRSTFTEKVYTFCRGNGKDLTESVDYAVQNPCYDTGGIANGAFVILTGSDDSQHGKLSSYVAGRYGCIPEILRGRGNETGALVFIPVSLNVLHRSCQNHSLSHFPP